MDKYHTWYKGHETKKVRPLYFYTHWLVSSVYFNGDRTFHDENLTVMSRKSLEQQAQLSVFLWLFAVRNIPVTSRLEHNIYTTQNCSAGWSWASQMYTLILVSKGKWWADVHSEQAWLLHKITQNPTTALTEVRNKNPPKNSSYHIVKSIMMRKMLHESRIFQFI